MNENGVPRPSSTNSLILSTARDHAYATDSLQVISSTQRLTGSSHKRPSAETANGGVSGTSIRPAKITFKRGTVENWCKIGIISGPAYDPGDGTRDDQPNSGA